MTLLQSAGVDLSRPETVRAVVDQLDKLVSRARGEPRSTVRVPSADFRLQIERHLTRLQTSDFRLQTDCLRRMLKSAV